MNDPGLDRPMKKAAEKLECGPYEYDQTQEEEEEHNFLDPRYTFKNDLLRWKQIGAENESQSLVVRLNGLPVDCKHIWPVANAFSIFALVQPWREYIPPGNPESQGDYIPDPH